LSSKNLHQKLIREKDQKKLKPKEDIIKDDNQLKFEVARYSLINGVAAGNKKYSVKRSTIYGWIGKYCDSLKRQKFETMVSDPSNLSRKERQKLGPVYGRDIETQIISMVESIRNNGGGIHWRTISMLCRAYIISYDRSTILSSYQFGKPWAQKWLLRHNYSLRTSTTSKQKKKRRSRY